MRGLRPGTSATTSYRIYVQRPCHLGKPGTQLKPPAWPQAAASKAIADAQAAGTPLTPKQLGALSGYVTTPPPPPPPTPPPTPTAPPTPTPLPAPASPTGQPQAAEALEVGVRYCC
jgi:hypothetical protein